MANTAEKSPTDAQLVSRLRRTKNGRTAAQLDTTAARLRSIDGVIEVDRVRTGKPGRPAVIFGLAGQHNPVVHDDSEGARTGELSEQPAA